MALINFQNYFFAYEGSSKWNLKEMNFTVKKGEILTIMGCNGSGKTTACLAAAGFLPSFYRGRIKGELSLFNKPAENLRNGSFSPPVGFLLQNPAAQLSRMKETVLEEVIFGLENFSCPPSEMENRAEEALGLAGLKGMEKRDPFSLSGGEQQRLAMAGLLVLNPEILIMDEPVSQMNPTARRSFYELFHELKLKGKAIMISSMDGLVSAEFSDHIVLLEDGRQIAFGSPQSLFNSETFLESGISHTPFRDCRKALEDLTDQVASGDPGFSLDQAYAYFSNNRKRNSNVTGH
jgi:energy-coupling factor transport system ATP-binding protein